MPHILAARRRHQYLNTRTILTITSLGADPVKKLF